MPRVVIFCFACSVFQVSKYIGSLYMKNRIEHTDYFNDFIDCMCQAVCVLFISVDNMIFWACLFLHVHRHTAYVFMSMDEESRVSANRAHWRAGVCVVIVHVWDSGGLQLYDPGATWHSRFGPALYNPAGGPSQEALTDYQYIHTNHLLKFNFNICWPDKYYADWKFCQHSGIIYFFNMFQDQLKWNNLRTVDGVQN